MMNLIKMNFFWHFHTISRANGEEKLVQRMQFFFLDSFPIEFFVPLMNDVLCMHV